MNQTEKRASAEEGYGEEVVMEIFK